MSNDDAQLEAMWRDPTYLLDQIDVGLDSQEIEDLPTWMLADEDGPYRGIENGRPFHNILERVLESRRTALEEWACITFGYCHVKAEHGETIALAKAVCDGLASVWANVPLPLATISCYCVQSLFLDKLCECPKHAVV
ncbi:hypothetical protein K9B35_07350 [Sphingomonas sp. R647]|uniref:hypothetical protein n=1 Tax=Sphingomonas sp. R647 TaxID=2875233 RepID=UPI001CD54BFD|nr:hypothetical protein [Sphingomonas sp. R647]MCA1197777.1 hypothetical protein [Sphingomonas sp. R647]